MDVPSIKETPDHLNQLCTTIQDLILREPYPPRASSSSLHSYIMANPLFSQEANYSDPHHSDLPYSMANPVFSPEQMVQLQDIISRAVASAIGTAFASQKELALDI